MSSSQNYSSPSLRTAFSVPKEKSSCQKLLHLAIWDQPVEIVSFRFLALAHCFKRVGNRQPRRLSIRWLGSLEQGRRKDFSRVYPTFLGPVYLPGCHVGWVLSNASHLYSSDSHSLCHEWWGWLNVHLITEWVHRTLSSYAFVQGRKIAHLSQRNSF